MKVRESPVICPHCGKSYQNLYKLCPICAHCRECGRMGKRVYLTLKIMSEEQLTTLRGISLAVEEGDQGAKDAWHDFLCELGYPLAANTHRYDCLSRGESCILIYGWILGKKFPGENWNYDRVSLSLLFQQEEKMRADNVEKEP